MNTRIYIPTIGRTGLMTQVTLRQFQQFSTHKPILVCPPSEAAAHKAYWPLVMRCPKQGIGPTRQWILEHSSADVVVMIDDDMRFYKRPDPTLPALKPLENLDTMIAVIERCVAKGYIHGGLSARQGNNRKDLAEVGEHNRRGYLEDGEVYVDSDRVNNFHWLNREAVLATGVRFDELRVMEDFYFTLSLLTRGYPNRVIYSYCWNQLGSGEEGGCSTYRTEKVQAEGAHGLHKSFPEFVKVVEKKSKESNLTSWKDFKARTDVQIYWLKAFLSSQVTS